MVKKIKKFKIKRILSLVLVCFVILFMGKYFEVDSYAYNPTPAVSIEPASIPFFYEFPEPLATGQMTQYGNNVEIDYSNTSDGYIMARLLKPTPRQVILRVTSPTDIVYTYLISTVRNYTVIPLSYGDGYYKVEVCKSLEGNLYAIVSVLEIDVTLSNDLAPFKRANQYINFNPGDKIVTKAAHLVREDHNTMEKVNTIYNYVIDNLTYDIEFANSVINGEQKRYIPDLDSVLERGKGVCFDYAALITGMLRSQGIPTQLVIGYAGDVYHAWIKVYSEESGSFVDAIEFDGSWNLLDPSFDSALKSNPIALRFFSQDRQYEEMFIF